MRRLSTAIIVFMLPACASASLDQGEVSQASEPVATATTPVSAEKIVSAPARPAPPESISLIKAQADETKDLNRQADLAEAMKQVEERQKIFKDANERVQLRGRMAQGGLVFGQTEPGSTVNFDGDPVMVGDDGAFVVGFGRDSALSSLLVVNLPDGETVRRSITIEDRDFRVERIDGLDQSKVSGFTQAQLDKIGVDRELKKAARADTHGVADWADGFDWPARGRISGVFGSQRILNGEPKRPHSGLDIAQPTGTPVKAPAAGVIRLAESDMYFEGGLILLDHGHWVESAFLHLSRLDVEPGQRVEKGDVIGAIGMTGRATGPHLHWSVKWRGRLVDPQLLLPEQEAKAPAAPTVKTASD